MNAFPDMPNVEALIDGNGSLEIGRIGPITCAAMGCDEHQMLFALVRRDGESLRDLMIRCEAALVKAYDEEIFTDEING